MIPWTRLAPKPRREQRDEPTGRGRHPLPLGELRLYCVTAHSNTLLPSANGQYCIEIRTMDDQYEGRSTLFCIQ